jgi:hypothetical protein
MGESCRLTLKNAVVPEKQGVQKRPVGAVPIFGLFLVLLCGSGVVPCSAQTDPPPYAPIAIPLPETVDQLKRDSVNLNISRIRLNQAGYRPGDEKLFYYVGASASAFSVINTETGAVAATGTMNSTGTQTSGQLDMKCFYKAQLVPGGAIKYELISPLVSGTVFKGLIPELPPGAYKVVVGTDTSSPFVISESVYGMIKDALLKYYGIARCGNNNSWFHLPCHLKDPVPGGWHDAGDHIKVPQSMGYAMSVLGLCAAALQDRDMDHYSINHAWTQATDGIPDVLAEVKIGTDFLISSYTLGGQTIAGMKTDIGSFGADHMWWGSPEYQDAVPVGRGGPPRPAVSGLGGNTAGTFCAALAFVGKLYQPYDATYAATCIKLAKEIYAWGKANQAPYQNAAMQSGGMTYDELSLGALALWWATKEAEYKDDLLYSKTIGPNGNAALYTKGGFAGGWFCHTNPGPQKTYANTCWDNLEVYSLWGLYRLILLDPILAASYGIDAAERLRLIENILYCQIVDIADVSVGNSTIDLPQSSFQWKGSTLKSDNLWGWMKIQDERWMPNRYQAGNITELYCYYDVANAIQGTALPSSPASTDWKVFEVKSVLVKQLNYMLGCNPWDVSMVVGVGDKNLNHPHHRASNPELQNVPGAFYRYFPPVGALSGGYVPSTPIYDEYMGGNDGYYHTEISLDATTALFLPVMGMAKQEILSPPQATVRVVSVTCDQAVIEVQQTRWGNATVRYGTGAVPDKSKSSDAAGVFHQITLSGLTKGTKYIFDVRVTDMQGRETIVTSIDFEKNPAYFTFTTQATCPVAEIANVKVCNVTSDSAEIFWYTPNGEFDSRVTYGFTMPPATVKTGDVAGHPVNFHYVKVGGLKEQTKYYFSVQSGATVDDNGGRFYSFTTPVEHVKFDIRAVQYPWGALPALGMNIVNQDLKSYDSLDIRLYFRAKDGFENDLGARMDIGIVYDAAGFQKEFTLNGGIRSAIMNQRPTKLTDTYNATDGTYAYYLSVPLWGVQMQTGSRIRLDIVFDQRSSFPPYQDLMNLPPKHVISATDWSFGPHYKSKGDPVDYKGIPNGAKDDVDANYWSQEVNQYICVYRKGEFVWGYSPSRSEQITKRTTYTLTSQITSPLSNPTQDYVRLENAVPKITVRGWATIDENGVINDVWVNGKRMADISTAAVYNAVTDTWDLAIPLDLVPGSNPIDITIFGGPQQACTECFGCDFGNHHFFIDYIAAKQYPSSMKLTDTLGKPLASDTARIDTTVFLVTVADKNGDASKKTRDTLSVLVYNPLLSDSTRVRCLETGESTGVFLSVTPIRVTSKPPAQTGPQEIAMAGGDQTIVFYSDPTDPTDTAQAVLIAIANFPVPKYGFILDANGDGRVDACRVLYTKQLSSPPDSIRIFFPTSTAQRSLSGAGSFSVAGSTLTATITPPFNGPVTGFRAKLSTNGMSWITVSGRVLPPYSFPLYDSAGPVLTNAALFEKAGTGDDLLTLAFSEPVDTNSLAGATLILLRQGTTQPVMLNVQKMSALRPDSGIIVSVKLPAGSAIAAGDSVKLAWTRAGGAVCDLHGNVPHEKNPPVPLSFIFAPPSIVRAWYTDADGNGAIDSIFVTFSRFIYLNQVQSFSYEWNNSTRYAYPDAMKKAGDSTIAVYIGGEVSKMGVIKTSDAMQVRLRCETSDRSAAAADSAGPVLVSVAYTPGAGAGGGRHDTLDVVFSEETVAPDSGRLFVFVNAGGTVFYRMDLKLLVRNGVSARFLVTGFLPAASFPTAGDSVWIDPAALIKDKSGAAQTHATNRRVLLEVKSPPVEWRIIVGPNPFVPGKSNAGVLALGTGFSPLGCLIAVQSDYLSSSSIATVQIYDALGSLVKEATLARSQNSLIFVWDGTNKSQRFVGSGSYLAVVRVVETGKDAEIKKMMIGVKRSQE